MQVLSTVRNLLASLVVFIIKSLSWDWRDPQQSITLGALAEDESSVPRTHMAGVGGGVANNCLHLQLQGI